jgi:hypothetical protein
MLVALKEWGQLGLATLLVGWREIWLRRSERKVAKLSRTVYCDGRTKDSER